MVLMIFMSRDGYSQQMTTEEFLRLRQTIKFDRRLNGYLRLQRPGSCFPRDWRKKMEIAEIYTRRETTRTLGTSRSMYQPVEM